MTAIDYRLLARAIGHYTSLGYSQVEVPWLVEPVVDDMTRPFNRREFHVPSLNLNLCASGEQGFIQEVRLWHLHASVEEQKYFTVTPCFRDERVDELHQRQFMKLELGIFVTKRERVRKFVDQLVHDAIWFHNAELPNENRLNPLATSRLTDSGIDIVGLSTKFASDEIELGSYGSRVVSPGWWIYGTGLALPRFSIYKERLLKEMK